MANRVDVDRLDHRRAAHDLICRSHGSGISIAQQCEIIKVTICHVKYKERLRMKLSSYRNGAVGAMMDEYERAALELRAIVAALSDDLYQRLMDAQTQDQNCRSIQTILSHVVSSGYSYADYLRECFGIPSMRPEKRLLSRTEALEQLDAMFSYTVATLDSRWEMPEEEIMRTLIRARWQVTYDMEQLLEHAIVHILRHRCITSNRVRTVKS
jgi:uncharacterized damage-inducible protein DinB